MVKKYKQFINEGVDTDNKPGNSPVHQDDDDLDYLNKMLGNHTDEEIPVKPVVKGGPVNDDGPTEGDRIVYYKEGSEHDGKTGIFAGIREDDGKYRIVFDDKKKLAS